MPQTVVTIAEGQIQGQVETDLVNGPFLAFYGIPYAKPPLGELRFKDPQPPEPWTGVRDGTKEGPPCYSRQTLSSLNGIEMVEVGSEDCLYLNVFTHKLKENQDDILKPVMVWIHGGAFTTGSGSRIMQGPELLMMEDILLVSINYRLGALGFLSIEDQQIGNAGLKDMVEALRWVKRNISQFGGDPDCVTIFGESAGGAAVHYLVLSPLTKGLIHRAIAQSGSALNPWARGRQDNAVALAQALGYADSDSKKILQFLRNEPVNKILEAQRKLGDGLYIDKIRYFSPTVEMKSESAFLCEEPIELMRSGRFNQVPYIMGYTSQEGLLLPFLEYVELGVSLTELVPFFLGYNQDDDNYAAANKRISKFYFDDEIPNEDNKTALYTAFTDLMFLRGIYVSVKSQARMSAKPTYLYKMTAETKLNVFKTILRSTEPGVVHADDLGYFFKAQLGPSIPEGSVEYLTMRKFIHLWTNFAHTGNPTPIAEQSLDNVLWRPVEGDQINFLDLGIALRADANPEADRMKFWDEILKPVPGY